MDTELRRTETYLGHEIEVEAIQDRPGHWRWTYLIDSKVTGVSKRAYLPSAEDALRHGFHAAKTRAGEL